ncbi:GreA/GreB family elongation factor [Paenibacillus sp. GD4]|jgi:transcription elongation factor GreA|uniref:GreA/GreB family elongation factor n=1 Tax=Paenibacillus sp. GD4 TaxID=3068890 RepID=UPI002796D341|nr:GreA/GreB family elongation factor [Paenibacillus sp. GD4]MDQ1909685.1 GreA/GreB family elongation factor [Paenibacillus sp. GD4]
MNRSSACELREKLTKQLIFFDEQMPMFLASYYPVYNREKTLMDKSVEQYVQLLERFLQLDDASLTQILNQIALIGSSVTVRHDDGSHEVFKVVLPSDVDPDDNKVSFFSPLGNQLLSKAEGETVTIQTSAAEYPLQIVEVKFE